MLYYVIIEDREELFISICWKSEDGVARVWDAVIDVRLLRDVVMRDGVVRDRFAVGCTVRFGVGRYGVNVVV